VWIMTSGAIMDYDSKNNDPKYNTSEYIAFENCWGEGDPPGNIVVRLLPVLTSLDGEVIHAVPNRIQTLHKFVISNWREAVNRAVQMMDFKDAMKCFLRNILTLSNRLCGVVDDGIIIYAVNQNEAKRIFDLALSLVFEGKVLTFWNEGGPGVSYVDAGTEGVN
jgi:hypothetical protein